MMASVGCDAYPFVMNPLLEPGREISDIAGEPDQRLGADPVGYRQTKLSAASMLPWPT